MTVQPARDIGAGFIYNAVDGTAQTPVCCTPEYLAGFGIGLDSTFGDGKVTGVLREDQAESSFRTMFSKEYDTGALGTLKKANDALRNWALKAMEKGEVNVAEAFKNPPPELATIINQIDASLTPQMKTYLETFFGKDVVKAGGSLGRLMAQTVVSSYDTSDFNGKDNKQVSSNQDRNDFGAKLTADADGGHLKAGTRPQVALGEIFQWSIETTVFREIYQKAAKSNESMKDFTNRAMKAMSQGDSTAFNQIATDAGVTPEQLQVILSSMMNNHANLMAGKDYQHSTKNGAHQFLNNIQDIDGGGGIDDKQDQAFQLLHVGSFGVEGGTANNDKEDGTDKGQQVDNNKNNEEKSQTAADKAKIANGQRTSIKDKAKERKKKSLDEMLIFTAGDNANGDNGGVDNGLKTAATNKVTTNLLGGLADDKAVLDDFKSDAKIATNPDVFKAELLQDLTAKGAGNNYETNGKKSTLYEDGGTIKIGNEDYDIQITDSEDFENEGYDVVVITIRDKTTGLTVFSMTATEDGKTKKLVEFADKNGDGRADKTATDGYTSGETQVTSINARLAGTVGVSGSTGSLAMNEDYNAKTDSWESNNKTSGVTAEQTAATTAYTSNKIGTTTGVITEISETNAINDGKAVDGSVSGGGEASATPDTLTTLTPAQIAALPANSPLATAVAGLATGTSVTTDGTYYYVGTDKYDLSGNRVTPVTSTM